LSLQQAQAAGMNLLAAGDQELIAKFDGLPPAIQVKAFAAIDR
jgi:hypothetical protein